MATISVKSRNCETLFPKQLNHIFGVRIAVIFLQVYNQQGEALLYYIKDVEMSRETWREGPGIEGDWYPKPAEPESESGD